MIKISIIIPVYNTEKYLKECIESTLNQSLKDIEIICINDGSTDNSLKILENYRKYDSRIKIINQKNKGVSEARNNGMKIARGKYIHFLDSDDFYSDNKALEILYNFIEEKKVDILFFDIILCYETSNSRFKKTSNNLNEKKIYSTDEILLKYIENEDISSSSCYKIFKRKMIEKIYYTKGIYFEDGEFLMRVFSEQGNVGIIRNNLLEIRERENSTTTSFKSEYIDSLVIIFETIDNIKYIKNYRKELYKLGMVCYILKLYLKSNIKNKKYEKEIKDLLKNNINIDLKYFFLVKVNIKRRIERLLVYKVFWLYFILLKLYFKVR